MRPFHLVRQEDVSGVSGTGIVAEGIQFSTGKCVLAWVTQYRSVAVYDSIEELEAIHGHDGRTSVEWCNPERQDDVQGAYVVEPDVLIGGPWLSHTDYRYAFAPFTDGVPVEVHITNTASLDLEKLSEELAQLLKRNT